MAPIQSPPDDRQIREATLKGVENNTGVQVEGISVIVDDGTVEVWA